MLSSYGADTGTAGTMTAGADPAGIVAASACVTVTDGAVQWAGRAGTMANAGAAALDRAVAAVRQRLSAAVRAQDRAVAAVCQRLRAAVRAQDRAVAAVRQRLRAAVRAQDRAVGAVRQRLRAAVRQRLRAAVRA